MCGRIFVVADIHGSAAVVKNIISLIGNPTPDDIIIVAGDAGFEYGKHVMGSAKRAAHRFIGKWIVMRGNHDNCYQDSHTHWNEEKQNYNLDAGWSWAEDGYSLYQNKYPNILYIPDNGGILKIKNFNFLFCPGAYSIDKMYRLRMNYPYNSNEQLSIEDMNKLIDIVKDWNKNGFDIDYVIGHTFPLYLERHYRDLFMSGISQTSIDKTTEKWLNIISEEYERNPAFKQYYGGHFHDSRVLDDKYTMVYQAPVQIV